MSYELCYDLIDLRIIIEALDRVTGKYSNI